MQYLSLYVQAGATYDLYSFRYLEDDAVTPVDLTGWSALLQVRETAASPDVALEVVPTITAATGMVEFTFTATETASLTGVNYVWAIELTSPDDVVVRLVGGKLVVSPEVVR